MNRPIYRRGGPPADHPGDPDYDLAVEEMGLIRPAAALAHIRRCSTTPCGVPDPHPLGHEGLLFAHNGTIPESILIELLTDGDPEYLEDHPPDYLGDYLDSELYFLYLLKVRHKNPELSRAEAIRLAARDLSHLTTGRLNFVLTTGDTLFVLRCARSDSTDPVRYAPVTGSPSPYWIAASQVLGSHPEEWAEIPVRTLAVLVPGEEPLFLALDDDTMGTSNAGDRGSQVVIGLARPNPAAGVVSVPLVGAFQGIPATIEVWDLGGRLVWKDGPRDLERGERELRWPGCDRSGRPVPSGSYLCRVQVGAERVDQRLAIVR